MLTTLLVASSLPLLAVAQSAASLAYTPVYGACPSGFTLVRQAGSSAAGNQTLNPQETAYISSRKSNVLPNAWKTYLSNIEATDVSLPSYVSDILSGDSGDYPNLGIACSGGGWRSAMFGAGVMSVLDSRNAASAALGTGGLLQAAQYLTGLSSGSLLVGTLAQANFPTMHDLIFGTNSTDPTNAWGGWFAQLSRAAPYTNATQNAEYIQLLVDEVRGKFEAGFSVSYVDVIARDNGRHFVNGTDINNFYDEFLVHGAGYTWSAVANVSTFMAYEQPFPIILATLLSPNGNLSTVVPGFLIPTSNPVVELNVLCVSDEMGSYDPTLAAFTPMKYLGTANESICATNFDQTSFIMGASGDADIFFNTSESTLINSPMYPILEVLNNTIPQTGVVLDGTLFPNPFLGPATEGAFIDADETILALSDGGSSGEVIPIQPLLVKARGVDTIFAIDASQDLENAYWSAGGSLINTQNRVNTLFPTAYSFPPVPTNISEFIAQNLSTRPTFFGCDSSTEAPLLIYLANGGPPRDGETSLTNVAPLNVTTEQMQAFLDQTYMIAMQGNSADPSSAIDPEWPACLACAVVDRARNRTGADRSGICCSCFERYCWNGSTYGL
ncbi:lysophospholipase [Suillus clintonianus]|uniref:lysophospholipase n=1 Tax=Suillus clintonianus TaxID=1904413 RepID=UPI001B886E40|nr:lysophospholipase [Suillus clintonianus]KAG2125810.1 lysophospholipase [Suillus clintonianus]